MFLSVYSILHWSSCHRFFISHYCRYQILWTFHGGILFYSSNCLWYVLKFECCYSTMSLLLPKSCLRLSYSLVVDCFNLFTGNKQRPRKDFRRVNNIKFWVTTINKWLSKIQNWGVIYLWAIVSVFPASHQLNKTSFRDNIWYSFK